MQIKADVAQAAALREEAQGLVLRDEALLEQLADASTTYCVCGLPNKLEGGMLACAHCPTLFHLACLGIPREREPKCFVCPTCCGTAGHCYAWAVRDSICNTKITPNKSGIVLCEGT